MGGDPNAGQDSTRVRLETWLKMGFCGAVAALGGTKVSR
jgi:hypothetical protein